MSDLTVVATITRDELSLAALSLESAGVQRITRAGLDVGSTTWRRETVSSPVVEGRALLACVKEMQTGRLQLRVHGTSMANLWTRMSTLTAAFSQRSYTLSFTLGGQVLQYACEPADWAVGDAGVIDELALMSTQQVITFLWPRMPTPDAGPF